MTNIAQHAFNTQNKVTVLSDGSKLFSSDFDSKCKFDIHRFDQIKFLRKRIKSSFAQNFLNKNKIDIIFFDSWIEDLSPILPALKISFPKKIFPPRKVPVVITRVFPYIFV